MAADGKVEASYFDERRMDLFVYGVIVGRDHLFFMIERAIARSSSCFSAGVALQLDSANLRLGCKLIKIACCFRLQGNNVPIATTRIAANPLHSEF